MKTLIGNLRYAMRVLRKNPALTAAVIATLTLGIGATTAIYTVVYATLLAPLPYPEPNQLVMVWSKDQGQRNVMSAGDFLDWQRQSTSFQQLAAFTDANFNLSTPEQPEQLDGMLTSPGWFQMQGIPFLMGRDFLPEEGVPGKDHVVVLTYRLWNRLGAKRDIIGKTVLLNNAPYTVVGVLSSGLPDRLELELAAPLAFKPEQINHDYHWLLTMGRMKPGVTLQQAQADMDAVTTHLAAAYPSSNRGWGAMVEPLKNDFLPTDRIHNLWLLLGAVGFVLLITCVNIANLLLAKGAARQREIAIRCSLGASRRQIFAQFLTESLMLAVLGGGLGIALGAGLLRVILRLVPVGILPSEADFRMNLPVLVVALAVSTVAGLLFGCAPAWYASRVDPGSSLKLGGRAGTGTGSHKLRRGLIIGEFGLALSLLAGAGLAIHSVWNLTRVDLGVRTDHVLTFRLHQPEGRFKTPEEMNGYNQRMLSALSSVAGVSHAATVTGMPLRGPSDGMPFTLVGGRTYGDPSQRPNAGFQSVSPDYFRTFGIQILQGRSFTEQDTATSVRVAMVNQEFANRYLKGMDPLKQRVSIEEIIPGQPQLGPAVEWQIVGIFHNVRSRDFRNENPEVDVPFAQSLQPSVGFGVRTAEDPAAMTKTIAAAVHSVDPQIALANVRTMDQVKDESLAEDMFTMRLFASFAVAALLLAAIGIYGLMAYTVSQRTQEIGLRLALGAGKSRVTRLILREASVLALVGLGIGLGGSVLVGRTMQTTLYGVGAIDLSVLLGVAVILFLTALLASYLPARRAAAIDPMQALRTD
ncbi:MAG TPA: ABC transporter permease [Granulicella sp.]|jgi:putative ABC transport system permease protein